MEKDERLTKEFIKNVFYDVDLKKLEESGADIPSPQKSPKKPTRDEKIKENNISPKVIYSRVCNRRRAGNNNAYPRISTIIFITFINIEIFYGFSLNYVVLWRGL